VTEKFYYYELVAATYDGKNRKEFRRKADLVVAVDYATGGLRIDKSRDFKQEPRQ
jgi:hypothetical protein